MTAPRRYHQVALNRHLAACFGAELDESGSRFCDPARAARETVYQLRNAEEWEALRDVLVQIPVFKIIYHGPGRNELLACWAAIGDRYDVEKEYTSEFENWRRRGNDMLDELDVAARIAEVLERLGWWDGAINLQRHRLRVAQRQTDRFHAADAHQRMGWLLNSVGRNDAALDEFSQARSLFEALDNRPGLAKTAGLVGNLYYQRGDYDAAMKCLREYEGICREIGDRYGLSYATGNIGNVHHYRGEYDRALKCYREQEEISREIGNANGVSMAVGNRGIICFYRGEFDRAVECWSEQRRICEEIGNRHEMATAVGNIGNVHKRRGEYDTALECYRHLESISREIGDPRGLSLAMGNMGGVFRDRGDYDQALECYRTQERICSELGNRRGLAMAIGNIGNLYHELDDYDRALECFGRQRLLCEELGDRRVLAIAMSNTAIALADRGEFDGAMESFENALVLHTEMGNRAGIVNVLLARSTSILAVMDVSEVSLANSSPTPRLSVVERLRRAQLDAEESSRIGTDLNIPSAVFDSQILMARIAAREQQGDVAYQRLTSMLEEATDSEGSPGRDEQRAELHYWIWRIARDNHKVADVETVRSEALRMYREVYATIPKHDYRKRIEELSGATEPDTRPETDIPTAE